MAAIRFGLIGRYLRPYRRTVLLGVAALVVVNLLSVALPLLVRGVIDDLQDGFTYTDVLRQAALIIALATVMGGVRLWSRMLVFGVGRQVEASLKQQIFDHMLRQEPGWVQTTGSGEVISRATSDVENVRRLLGFAVLSLTNTALAYALTLPAMLAIDPLLSLAAVGLFGLFDAVFTPAYFEDSDLCRRYVHAGCRLAWIPIQHVHAYFGSGEKLIRRKREELLAEHGDYHARNRALFRRRWMNGPVPPVVEDSVPLQWPNVYRPQHGSDGGSCSR